MNIHTYLQGLGTQHSKKTKKKEKQRNAMNMLDTEGCEVATVSSAGGGEPVEIHRSKPWAKGQRRLQEEGCHQKEVKTNTRLSLAPVRQRPGHRSRTLHLSAGRCEVSSHPDHRGHWQASSNSKIHGGSHSDGTKQVRQAGWLTGGQQAVMPREIQDSEESC